jgi:hypothetical protein
MRQRPVQQPMIQPRIQKQTAPAAGQQRAQKAKRRGQ